MTDAGIIGGVDIGMVPAMLVASGTVTILATLHVQRASTMTHSSSSASLCKTALILNFRRTYVFLEDAIVVRQERNSVRKLAFCGHCPCCSAVSPLCKSVAPLIMCDSYPYNIGCSFWISEVARQIRGCLSQQMKAVSSCCTLRIH